MCIKTFAVVSLLFIVGVTAPRAGVELSRSSFGEYVSGKEQQNIEKLKAAELWEKAIAAKGGRERLYKIHNVLVSAELSYITQHGKRNKVHREYLYVLPNQYWFYENYGSDLFGVRIEMLNYDAGTRYAGVPGNLETKLEALAESERRKGLDNAVLALLLETKWLRPVPMTTSSTFVGGKRVNVVETEANGRKVDYALDSETNLPIRVTFYDISNGKTYANVQSLSDYTNTDGIQVPKQVTLEDGGVEKSIVRFNVRYDPELFIHPPSHVHLPIGRE